jgi:ribosome-associated protein
MTHSHAHEQTRILVQAAARVCDEKKGEDTRILELDPVDSGLADFFLITSARNERQAQTIADEIEYTLKRDHGVFATSVEGRRQGDWVLLDYVDFVVHVFLVEKRAFYDIERLRKSARPITPPEFDEELKAALTAKTRSARSKSVTKEKPPAAAKAAKPTLAKRPADAKAKKAAKKAPAASTSTAKKASATPAANGAKSQRAPAKKRAGKTA